MNTSGTPAHAPPPPVPFTRFVLPFSWRRTPVPTVPGDAPRYRRAKDAGIETPGPGDWLTTWTPKLWEHSYFLHEIQEAVYGRAHWFALSGAHSAKTSAPIIIQMPGLILFEADGECPETLRHGLLVLQIEGKPDAVQNLEQWLEWNENLRLIQSPYDAAGEHLVNLLQALFPEQGLPTTKEATVGRWLDLLEHPVQDRNGYFHLWQREHGRTLPDEIFPYSDSRAFVWSGLLHDDASLQNLLPLCLDRDSFGTGCGAWVKALNIDTPGEDCGPLDSETQFERQWVARHTYLRWVERGTLYGFTPHSGVMLTARSHSKAGRNLNYFKQSQFALICLLLYMRQCLSRIGIDLNRQTVRLMNGRDREEAAAEKFAALRRDFLIFTNLYWFPQLSNQQQAQEMFLLARAALGVEAQYEELRREIESTEAWLQERDQSAQAESGGKLNWIAGIGLVLSLAVATYDVAGKDKDNEWSIKLSWGTGVLIVLGLIFFIVMCPRLREWFKKFQ